MNRLLSKTYNLPMGQLHQSNAAPPAMPNSGALPNFG